MSDPAVNDVTTPGQGPAQPSTSAGALLRQAREAARMQLPTLAAMLKVPQHKLEDLEADNYQAFPDQVFMRALAQGVCRTLRVDAQPVMDLLPRTAPRSLGGTGSGLNETIKERSHFKASGTPLDSREGGSRKIVVGVLLLLAAAAAMYFIPFQQAGEDGVEGVAAVVSDSESLSRLEAEVSADTDLAQAAEPAATQAAPAGMVTEPVASAVSAASVVPATAAPATAAPVAGAVPADPSPAASQAEQPAASADALLQLKASEPSWIQVKDAAGKLVLEKTLAKDEAVTAQGALPLSVVVGNARGTQVLVRGKPIDISTTRDNVARFEVK